MIHIQSIFEIDYFINPESITAFEIVKVKDKVDMDAEYGLPVYVEYYQCSILLNTGQLITVNKLYPDIEEIRKEFNL